MAKMEAAIRKPQAHDRWVCFRCRWTTKLALVDVRSAHRPSYACPRCRVPMQWTGTAFRPPRRGDDEGWQVAFAFAPAGSGDGCRARWERSNPGWPNTATTLGCLSARFRCAPTPTVRGPGAAARARCPKTKACWSGSTAAGAGQIVRRWRKAFAAAAGRDREPPASRAIPRAIDARAAGATTLTE
jgi:hypothetical protein